MNAMAEILSQQQIDELLGNVLSGDIDLDVINEQSGKTKIKEYDFRSPKKFTREQIKLLGSIHENFVKLAASQLSGLLRANFELEVIQTEEQQFYEFNNALHDSVLMGFIDLQKDEEGDARQQILIEVARPVSFYIIDRLLGGGEDSSEHYLSITREYTDIELSIIDYFLKQIVMILRHAWTNYFPVDPILDSIATNSRLMQTISPDETVVIVVMKATVNELSGTINICLPKTTLDIVFRAYESKYARPAHLSAGNEQKKHQYKKNIMEQLNDSALQIKCLLGDTEITVEELMNLEAGDIIPLHTSVTEDRIAVHIEGMPWFYGSLGSKNNKYAVKLIDQY